MTDNKETVKVPVELLEHAAEVIEKAFGPHGCASVLRDLLPKPKPRLVAVNLDEWTPVVGFEDWVRRGPDLLTLLDDAVDGIPTFTQESRDLVKARMRTALGVKAD